MTPTRTPPKAGKTCAEWLDIERAAIEELQRRAAAAHAEILQLLQRHAPAFTPRQRAAIGRRVRGRR